MAWHAGQKAAVISGGQLDATDSQTHAHHERHDFGRGLVDCLWLSTARYISTALDGSNNVAPCSPSQPQTCWIACSGMTLSALLWFTELPETVFAAAVPASYERKVSTLVDDVYGDHEYMVRLMHAGRIGLRSDCQLCKLRLHAHALGSASST